MFHSASSGQQRVKVKIDAYTEGRKIKHRQSCLVFDQATHPVVVCAVDVSRHAEVPDLDHQALSHQTVAGRQVAVDKVQRCQVDHARGDLGGDLQHLRQSELTQRGHLGLLQDTSIGAVSSTDTRAQETDSFWITAIIEMMLYSASLHPGSDGIRIYTLT